MIEEIGTVVEIHEGWALVRTERSSACAGCASMGLCHITEGGDECTVEADNPDHAVIGQKVRVAVPISGFLKGTFFLYLFPLAGLFAGMVAGLWLAGQYARGREDLFAAAGALLGLLLFFALQRLFNKRFERNKEFRPRIVEVL
ncbi:MAG: SoxR reducing system RseC family protein [bacterium]